MWRVGSRLQSTGEEFENEAKETDGAWLQRNDEESREGGRFKGDLWVHVLEEEE